MNSSAKIETVGDRYLIRSPRVEASVLCFYANDGRQIVLVAKVEDIYPTVKTIDVRSSIVYLELPNGIKKKVHLDKLGLYY